MILTDREILISLKTGSVKIDPHPDLDAFSSTSVDLTLANRFSRWATPIGVPIRPGKAGFKYKPLVQFQDHSEGPFILEPQKFVLAWTRERIEIPYTSRLAARVEGKSTIARIGVGIHVTAPTIHSGFKGPIQLEIFNFGPNDVLLDEGTRICQLIFELTLGTPDKGYEGAFLDQDVAALTEV